MCILAITTLLAQFRTATAQPPVTTISVDLSRTIGDVEPLVLGVNHRYAFNGYGMWGPNTHAPAPGFLEEFTASGFKVVRFPGGLVANNYHWKRAIGPVAERGLNVAGIEGQPLENTFGPDEFGSFIEAAGAEGTIVVNASTAGPGDAADWVEYMNTPSGPGNPRGGTDWAEVRAANGHPEPYSIRYWEVGNEPWHRRQKYWIGAKTRRDRLAHRYAFGGTTGFFDQPVALPSDYRFSAAFSSGDPNQVFTVRFPPVEPEGMELQVGNSIWRRVDDLTTAGDRRVFTLDNRSGHITFGDGISGAIPPQGAQIVASYVSGPHAGYVGFRRMMKRVDPTIEVGSALSRPPFVRAMGARPYDFIVMHLRGGHRIPRTDISTIHEEVVLEPARQAHRVNVLRALIRRNTGESPRDKVLVTEWGPHRALAQVADRYLISLDSALYSALQIKEWIEIGLPLAERHTLIDFAPGDDDVPSFGHRDEAVMGPAPAFVTSATQLVFALYAQLVDESVAPVEIARNPVTTTALGGSLTALEVLASSDANAVHVLVINRHSSDDVETHIDLGPNGAPPGEVTISELNGDSILAFNTADNPNAVRVMTTTAGYDGTELVRVFPAHSVTLLTFPR